MTHIGIIIPSTTKGIPNCTNYNNTFFYNILLKSFIKTACKEYNYTIYLVVDDDDPIYSNPEQRGKIISFVKLLNNTELIFISSNGINKGHVTEMWNRAFKMAYDDNCEYFYQCGDDIEFMDKGWVSACVNKLKDNNDIGVTGPLDWGRELFKRKNNPNHKLLLTQTFVSRKHMEFFGFYYPPEIINWWCDDWITLIYSNKNLFYQMSNHRIINKGGQPRYTPVGAGSQKDSMSNICNKLVDKFIDNIVLKN